MSLQTVRVNSSTSFQFENSTYSANEMANGESCIQIEWNYLESESYQFHDTDVLYEEVKVVTDHFKSMLMANGCSTEHLKKEFEILHNHIKRYVSKNTPEKCSQIIFNISCVLSIRNLLHVKLFHVFTFIQCRVQTCFLFLMKFVFQRETIVKAQNP